MLRHLVRVALRRWVIGLMAVALFGVLVWFGGPLVAVADYKPLLAEGARFAVIALLLVCWGFDNLRNRTAERRAGEELTERLAAEPETTDTPANAEQVVLAERLREALRILQGARLGRGRKLYQLPWYVIIGAPGSGKTTALKNAGLRFPLESQLGDGPMQGTGGTRYCDWWFTDEAVLLDTAGRYTMQDSPKDGAGVAWRAFLAHLKKGRPLRPLNGVIVAISILDLVNKTPTEQALQATTIKQRIQELNTGLDMALPIYVIFTKCDRVVGFNEFFADLDATERQRAWGLQLPLGRDGPSADDLAELGDRLQALLQRANDRVLGRLRREPSAVCRARIFEFPRQFLALKAPVLALLQDIFAASRFEQPMLLRGVYFASGTQTPEPARWVSTVASSDCRAPPLGAAVNIQPKSYFLERLFSSTIFGEAELAATNSKASRRFRWRYGALVAAVMTLFSAVLSAFYVSHAANHAFLDEVAAGVASFTESSLNHSQHPRSLEALADRLDRLRALPGGYGETGRSVPVARRLGLDQGDKLGAQERWLYLTFLERTFMPRVANDLASQLDPANPQDDYLYEALRYYLMLALPERMEAAPFALWADVIWGRLHFGPAGAALRSRLAVHLSTALQEQVPTPVLDAERIAQARQRLARTPIAQRVYRQVKRAYLDELPDEFSVAGVLGRKAEAVFVRRSGLPLDRGVPKFFTYDVFQGRLVLESKRFAQRISKERWIYGDAGAAPSDADVSGLGDRVAALYLDEYRAVWKAFLDDLSIRRFDDAIEGRAVLQALAGIDAPLVELVMAIRRHTALNELPPSAATVTKVADAATQQLMTNERRRLENLVPENSVAAVSLPGKAVADAFADFNGFAARAQGSALQRVQQSLVVMDDYLDQLAAAGDADPAIAALDAKSADGATALRELSSSLAAAPDPIKQWFGSITPDTQQARSRVSGAHANSSWRSEVLPFYERAIKGRYPVAPTADTEIRLDDFGRFFGPQGIIDRYFEHHIEPLVDTSRPVWRWRRPGGLSGEALAFFQRARQVRDAWFEGPGRPRVSFTLLPYQLDATVIRALVEVAGETVTYEHGPRRPRTMHWPGEVGSPSRLVFNLASQGTPISVRAEGEWAWFRLIDQFGSMTADEGSSMLALSVKGITARYRLETASALNPFTDSAVRNLKIPERL